MWTITNMLVVCGIIFVIENAIEIWKDHKEYLKEEEA